MYLPPGVMEEKLEEFCIVILPEFLKGNDFEPPLAYLLIFKIFIHTLLNVMLSFCKWIP